jgi:chromosome segregation ATPase
MGDKNKDLEARVDRLESRLKTTFLEIERRFEAQKMEDPVVSAFETRIQELEDLLLLLQLEITKIKDKVGSGEQFISASPRLDLEERIKKIEETATGDLKPVARPYEQSKLERLERKLNELESAMKTPTGGVGDQFDEIERRLDKLESSRNVIRTNAVLEDVRRILES